MLLIIRKICVTFHTWIDVERGTGDIVGRSRNFVCVVCVFSEEILITLPEECTPK